MCVYECVGMYVCVFVRVDLFSLGVFFIRDSNYVSVCVYMCLFFVFKCFRVFMFMFF